ncbi:MAG: outer membrane protein [Beijerinckiaceae bacterium]
MKKFLLASTAVILAAPALAADLPRRSAAVAPSPAPIMVAMNWSGFYVGLHAGYGWADDRWLSTASASAFTDRLAGDAFSYDQKGWLGGAQIGYNWQFNNIVLGLEASGSYADVKESALSVFGAADDVFSTKYRTILSGAARAGFTFSNALLYAKVGYAAVDVKRSTVDALPANIGVNAASNWHSGLLLGAGLEYAFTQNWSAALEYNYYNLNKKSSAYVSGDADRFDPKMSTVTLRLNYRFGGPAAPIVARY